MTDIASEGIAAAGVIRQTLEQAQKKLAGGYEATLTEALNASIDQTVAVALSAAGYFDQVMPDTEVAVELEEKNKRLDAFLDFATRLAEVAGSQPPSDLVDGVEDLVDEVITKMLSDGGGDGD